MVVWGDSGHDDAPWTLAMATEVKAWAETNGGGIVSTSWVPYALDDNAIDLAMDDLTPISASPRSSGSRDGAGAPDPALEASPTSGGRAPLDRRHRLLTWRQFGELV